MIKPFYEIIRAAGICKFEMRSLSYRVYARVGSSAAVNAYVLPRKTFYGVFQSFLNGVEPLLFLPAVIRRSYIIHDKKYRHINHRNVEKSTIAGNQLKVTASTSAN